MEWQRKQDILLMIWFVELNLIGKIEIEYMSDWNTKVWLEVIVAKRESMVTRKTYEKNYFIQKLEAQ